MRGNPIEPFLVACADALGADAVARDPELLSAHAVDFWGYAEGRTPAVLRPRSTGEVARIVALAAGHGVALVPQSGNTGLVGGNVPDRSGAQVVVSLARLDRIREVDATGEVLVAEAGATLASVREAALAHDLLFPLSFGSEGTCRIGGNVGTNAGGLNVLRYGMTRDLVLGLEVVLADGRVWEGLSSLRKDNTGYDLKQLFIGAEGSLGIVTAASLRLFPQPRERTTLFLAVPDARAALSLLARTRRRFGEIVSSFELIHEICVDAACENLPGVRFPLASRAPWYVLVELAWSAGAGLDDASEEFVGEAAEAGLVLDGTRAQNEAQRGSLWRMREGISEALRHRGTIARNDVSVPVSAIPTLLERAETMIAARFSGAVLAAFGHVGDGNLHMNVLLAPDTPSVASVREALQHEIFDLVEGLGGSISAEHGIGRLKREEFHARKPALDIELMRRLKAALDPQGILNPGVIV